MTGVGARRSIFTSAHCARHCRLVSLVREFVYCTIHTQHHDYQYAKILVLEIFGETRIFAFVCRASRLSLYEVDRGGKRAIVATSQNRSSQMMTRERKRERVTPCVTLNTNALLVADEVFDIHLYVYGVVYGT